MKCCGLLLICILFLSLQLKAQKIKFSEKKSSKHTYVRGAEFEGVVFSREFTFPFMPESSEADRFTPSTNEIEEAERLLAKDLKAVNHLQRGQGGSLGPVIHQNLNNFIRQYYGYLSAEGEKIIFISCLLKNNYTSNAKEIPNWQKGAVIVLNGGSNYWQVRANLKTKSLFGLAINGVED